MSYTEALSDGRQMDGAAAKGRLGSGGPKLLRVFHAHLNAPPQIRAF